MASNRREDPKEVRIPRIPDEVIFGVEVNEDHYNSCDEDDDGRLLVTEASEEDCRALRKEWEMESEAQTISNTDENLAENGALRIFFWLLDRAIFSMFIVLVNYYQDTGDERFKRYAADGGRYIFQIDLGIALLDYGIREDWPLSNDEIWELSKRPRWMRNKDVIPCNCAGPAKCFFCSEEITNGVHHDSAKINFHSPGTGKKRKLDVQCTNIRWALPNYKKSKPCEQCKSKPEGQKIFYSSMGCPRCNKPICKHCWKDGYKNDHHRPLSMSKLKMS